MHVERIVRPSDYAAVAAVIRESLTLSFYVCLKCVLAKCEIFPKKICNSAGAANKIFCK